MYTKILLPTDGSTLAEAAMQAGAEFAALCRADIVGLYVAPEYEYPVSVEIIPPDYPSEDEYVAATRKTGDEYLAALRRAAADSGLKYTGITAYSDKPAHRIVEMAQEQDCDLIFIGSHGRAGFEQLPVGSLRRCLTSKVLSLCDIPVLVYRRTRENR